MALPAKDADIGMMLIHYHTFTYIYTHTQPGARSQDTARHTWLRHNEEAGGSSVLNPLPQQLVISEECFRNHKSASQALRIAES